MFACFTILTILVIGLIISLLVAVEYKIILS